MANPISRVPNQGNLDRVISPAAATTPGKVPSQTYGAPGFQVIGGYLASNEKNSKLDGTERYRTFSDILANVSIVAAGTRYFSNLVAKSGWIFEPAESDSFSAADQAKAKEYAELIEHMTGDMEQPWSRIVRRASLYKFYGFSLAEWTAKRRDDGLIGMLDVATRPQSTIERWSVDRVGTVQSVIQRSPQDSREIAIARGKLVYALDDTLSDSPEGIGLLRHLAEPAERLQRYQLLEAFGFDTELRGIPIIYAPLTEINDDDSMTAAQKGAAVAWAKDFLQNHARSTETGVMFDSAVYTGEDDAASPSSTRKWELNLVQGSGSGTAEVAVAIERLNREMARIMGVEGLLLGGEKVGSMALSQDKSQNFALIVDSTLTELADVFRRDWVRPIFILNGWDERLMPSLKCDQVQYRDIEQVTRALTDLATAGSPLEIDDPAVDTVRDLLGLPRPPELTEEQVAAQAGIRSENSDPGPEGDADEPDTEIGSQPDVSPDDEV